MSAPILIDTQALARQRRRALQAPALILHELTADEIEDRLREIKRSFTAIIVVTPFPQVWEGRLPGARVIHDAEILDLEPGSQDLVIHALALHWSNDPVGQIIQCARALRPDGLFLAAAFGGQTLAELRAALAEAEAEVAGGLSPRVLPMAEIREMGGLLQRAGLALPVADSQPRRLSYRDAFHLMRDLRAMGEGNALTARRKSFTRSEVLARAAAIYAENFSEGDRVIATFETVFLTAWKPHESQQKPLRPGSAVQRLEEALRSVRDESPQQD